MARTVWLVAWSNLMRQRGEQFDETPFNRFVAVNVLLVRP